MNLSKLYNEEIMRLSTFYDGYACIIRYNLNKNCVECMKGETLSGIIKVGMSLDECYEKIEYLLRNEKSMDTFSNILTLAKGHLLPRCRSALMIRLVLFLCGLM